LQLTENVAKIAKAKIIFFIFSFFFNC
jgi:hypothetical protein